MVAGGCFWGVQGVFQHVDGVTSAVSGYDGGEKATAHYEMTSEGNTGHAESVQITFDPRKITYGRILQVFFSVAHDPTELNRQGPDEGTQYRSAIFPVNDEQARVAKAYIAQLDSAHAFQAPIATTIEPGKTFYRAEDYHQDFLAQNPGYPYIVFNDLPKIANLKRLFPALYRPGPGAGRREVLGLPPSSRLQRQGGEAGRMRGSRKARDRPACHPRARGDPEAAPKAGCPHSLGMTEPARAVRIGQVLRLSELWYVPSVHQKGRNDRRAFPGRIRQETRSSEGLTCEKMK